MERMGHDSSIVERILSAPGRAVLVLGPAGAGKTTAAMAVWDHLRDRAGRGCTVICPNAATVADLKAGAISASPGGVIVSPRIMTFASLASLMLTETKRRAPVQSPMRRRLALRQIVNGLREAGELTVLAPVADTPGLIVTLDRAIGELKRAAVEPDALAGAIGDVARSKGRDVLAVYRRYQDRLHQAALYDVEGRMWLARDLLASGEVTLPLPALVVDGFTDFTPTQLDILRLLADRGTRVVITLPWADDGRPRMWHWTLRTLNNVRRTFGEHLAEITLEPRPASFAPLCRAVFDFDAVPREAPEGLSVIAAAGIEAEVSAVARRVKRLLVEGAAAGSIAVLVRSTDAYQGTIRRVFDTCDIPIARVSRPLSDMPIVRFVLDLASLGPAWAFRDVLRVIKSSYFRPQSLGPFDETTVAVAEMLIREGNVLGGREDYPAAAARLGRRAARAVAADETEGDPRDAALFALGPLAVTPEALAEAAAMLDALFDLVAGAVGEGVPVVDGLRRLIDALALGQACDHGEADLMARDLRAMAMLDAALAEADGAAPAALGDLMEALSAVSCPPARGEALVDVWSILDARAIRREHVFVLGLGEGQFPGRFTENSLVSEADRAAWASRGVQLDARADLNAREMLLFYLGVSRAETSLTLSHLSADAGGRPGALGSYLLSLLRGVGGLDGADVETVTPGQLVPLPAEIASPRDALSAGLAGLFRGDLGDPGDALSWASAALPGPLARAAAGLWAHNRRWTAGPCDAFDGRLTEPPLLAALARRFSDQAVFSARQLDTFGQCPWRFFAQYVLDLNELPEPQRLLEPTARGLFCHDVLCRTYRLLAERFGLPVRLAELAEDDLQDALNAAVAAASDAVEAQRPPYPMLWRIQREQMRRELERYLLAQRTQPDMPAASLYFELAFGMGDRTVNADPASLTDPVSITLTEGRSIRVKGRIDRVDRAAFEGDEGLLVIDYKTGALPSVKDITACRNVQAPLYSAVVAEMFAPDAMGGVFHRVGGDLAERYFARVKRHGGRIRPDAAYDANRDAVMSRITEFIDAMRAGRFDVVPSGGCAYCPFRQICQFSEPRAKAKGGVR